MVWMLWVLWTCVLLAGLFGAWSALKLSGQHAWVLLVVAVLALGLRIGWRGDHFYGLEYEDAYVYAVASRYVTPTTHAWEPAGLAVCAIGSLDRCIEWERFPGHLMGLPAILAAVQAWVGYRPALPPILGGALSTFAALVVWWTAWAVYRSFRSAAVAGVVFAVTPAIALYGGSACSESASSAAVAVAFGATAMCRRSERARDWWAWQSAVLVAASLAVCIRRENVVLVMLAPLFLWPTKGQGPATKRWWLLAVWAALGAMAGLMFFPSLVSEVGEFGSVSFGIGRFIRTLPVVLQALAAPQWFGLVAVGAGVGVWRSLRDSARGGDSEVDTGLLLGVAAVTLAMLTLYSSHVRSAYQLAGESVQPFDFLRYLSNAGVALAILAVPAVPGAIMGKNAGRGRWRPILVGAAVALYIVASASASLVLRNEMVKSEDDARRQPALQAIAAADELGDRFPIVTLEPLLVQIYGSVSTQVMSLQFLTPERVRTAGGRVLYLRHDHYQSDVNRMRYWQGLSALPTESVRQLRAGRGWTVLTLGAAAANDR